MAFRSQWRWPWVSRRAYELQMAQNTSLASRLVDAECDRERVEQRLTTRDEAYDRLVQQVVTLKRKGFEPSTAGKVIKQPDAEAIALNDVNRRVIERAREADRTFVDTAVQDLMAQGLSQADAKKEAARLRGEVTDSHPGGG